MNLKIKQLRKRLKMNQEEFGNRLGVTTSTVSKWEKGTRKVPDSIQKLIEKEFNANLIWLATGNGDMFNQSDDKIMDLFRSVNFGDNEFHKNLFRAFSEFDKSEWDALESMINKINNQGKPQ